VQAYVGQDTFVFNTYQVAHPGPHDVPLSTYASGITTVSGRPSPLVFTLEGVVQSITLSVPSPESSNAPLTADLPIGTPATFPLVGHAEGCERRRNPDRHVCVPDFTLRRTRRGIGLKLRVAMSWKSWPHERAKITLVCGNELAGVTVTYDGSLTPAAGGGYVDSATIVAAAAARLRPRSRPQRWPSRASLRALPDGHVTRRLRRVAGFRLSHRRHARRGRYHRQRRPPGRIQSRNAGDGHDAAAGVFSADAPGRPEQPHLDRRTVSVARPQCYTGFGAPPAFVSTTGGGNPVFPTATVEDAAGNVWWTGSDGTGAIWTGFVADARELPRHRDVERRDRNRRNPLLLERNRGGPTGRLDRRQPTV